MGRDRVTEQEEVGCWVAAAGAAGRHLYGRLPDVGVLSQPAIPTGLALGMHGLSILLYHSKCGRRATIKAMSEACGYLAWCIAENGS